MGLTQTAANIYSKCRSTYLSVCVLLARAFSLSVFLCPLPSFCTVDSIVNWSVRSGARMCLPVRSRSFRRLSSVCVARRAQLLILFETFRCRFAVAVAFIQFRVVHLKSRKLQFCSRRCVFGRSSEFSIFFFFRFSFSCPIWVLPLDKSQVEINATDPLHVIRRVHGCAARQWNQSDTHICKRRTRKK